MNIELIKQKVQQSREDNALKIIPLPEGVITREIIALNTKENEYRLGADAAYETIQKLLESEKDSYQPKLIRIDLTSSEIERLFQGEVIKTQYPWLSIGKKY